LARNLALHFVFTLVFAALQIFLRMLGSKLFLPWNDAYVLVMPIAVLFAGMGASNVMICWGIIAVSQALNYFRKLQERNLQFAQAQLQVLKTQLHPHFLFNTINAISELVYEEPETADKTLGQLSDLLRSSLKSDKTQQVSLKEEMDFLEKYIEIQQTLLQHRLKVEIDIAPETLDAVVPNMILQPLAENAIRHGIAPSLSGGTLRIASQRENGNLRLTVRDDGAGLNAYSEIVKSEGIGLSNTCTRLRQLYGNAYSFQISEPQNGGVLVSIAIPFHETEGMSREN
jgi:LytS/YehU family sensor histidine kinase